MQEDAYHIATKEEARRCEFQFIHSDSGEPVTTLFVRNVLTGTFLFISLIEETNEYALLELWEKDRDLGTIPILKDEEVNTIIKNESIETICGLVWERYLEAEAAFGLLNQKRLAEFERYTSKLHLIAHHAAIVIANTIGVIYLDLARSENKDTAGLDEWEKSGRAPEWLDRVVKSLHLLTLRWFDKYPEEAKAIHRDYWRAVVSIALQELKSRGERGHPRKQLRSLLNKWIFDSDESDCFYKATAYSGRAFAVRELQRLKPRPSSIDEWDKILGIRVKPVNDRRCKPSPFIFEQEPILPFGSVEEKIRMNWQIPGPSDLEILHGGVRNESLSSYDLDELLGDSIKIWRNRDGIWRNARENLDEFEFCGSFFFWIINENRRIRRFLRARYGIDLARRIVLRKAIMPKTAKETAERALWYAEAMVFEAATQASHFTFDWITDKFREEGQDLTTARTGALKKAVKAMLGVMEAFPLFHLALLNRASNSAVRDAETYFLCGIGSSIKWKSFPSLYESLCREDYARLSNRDARIRFLKLLPGGVLYALEGRQIGEPLINGRNSFRNKVSKFLREQGSPKNHREQPDGIPLDEVSSDDRVRGIRRFAAEDHVLIEEVRAKIARDISRSHLSPQQRAIIELKLLENKSQSEIAAALGLSKNQVKVQQSRAFKKAPSLKAYSEQFSRSNSYQANL